MEDTRCSGVLAARDVECRQQVSIKSATHSLQALREIVLQNSILFTSDETNTIRDAVHLLQMFLEDAAQASQPTITERSCLSEPPLQELKESSRVKDQIDQMLGEIEDLGQARRQNNMLTQAYSHQTSTQVIGDDDLLMAFKDLMFQEQATVVARREAPSMKQVEQTNKTSEEENHALEVQKDLQKHKDALQKLRDLHSTNMRSLETVCTEFERQKLQFSARIASLESEVRQQQAKIMCLETQLSLCSSQGPLLMQPFRSSEDKEQARIASVANKREQEPVLAEDHLSWRVFSKQQPTQSPGYRSGSNPKHHLQQPSTAPDLQSPWTKSHEAAKQGVDWDMKVSRFELFSSLDKADPPHQVAFRPYQIPQMASSSVTTGLQPTPYMSLGPSAYGHLKPEPDVRKTELTTHHIEHQKYDFQAEQDTLLPRRLLQTPSKPTSGQISRALADLAPLQRFSHTFSPTTRPLIRLIHSPNMFRELPAALKHKLAECEKTGNLEQAVVQAQATHADPTLWSLSHLQLSKPSETPESLVSVLVCDTIQTEWLQQITSGFFPEHDRFHLLTLSGWSHTFRLNLTSPVLSIDEPLALVVKFDQTARNKWKGQETDKGRVILPKDETRVLLLIPPADFERAFARASESSPNRSVASHPLLRAVLQRVYSKHFKLVSIQQLNSALGRDSLTEDVAVLLDATTLWDAELGAFFYLNTSRLTEQYDERPPPETRDLAIQRLTDLLYLLQAEKPTV